MIVTFLDIRVLTLKLDEGFEKVFSCASFETYSIDRVKGVILAKISSATYKFVNNSYYSYICKDISFLHNINHEINCKDGDEFLRKSFSYWVNIRSLPDPDSTSDMIVVNNIFPVISNFFHEMIAYHRELKYLKKEIYPYLFEPDDYYPRFTDLNVYVNKKEKDFNSSLLLYADRNGLNMEGKYFDTKEKCNLYKKLFILEFFS